MGGARVVAQKGTLANPTKVPSHLDQRVVGCCCAYYGAVFCPVVGGQRVAGHLFGAAGCWAAGNPDAEVIMWLTVKRGQLSTCNCGHVYQLVDAANEVSW